MKKLIVGLVVLSSLVSCKKFTGTITAENDVTISNGKQSLELAPGSHNATLKVCGKRNFKLKVADQKLKVKLNKGVIIPATGEFTIAADQSNISKEIIGKIIENSTLSERRTSYESCTYTHYYTVCGHNGCHQVSRTVFGNRFIEYRMKTTTKSVNVSIEDVAFNSSKVNRNTVYSYVGPCR